MANVAPNNILIPTPESLMGGFIIADLITLMLYGVTIAQAYTYAQNSRGDPWLIKTIVGLVAILETVHSGVVMNQVYKHTIVDFGHLERIATITWHSQFSVTCGLFIVILVQGFYISRIYILSGRKMWLTTFAGVLLFLRVAASVAIIVLLYHFDSWAMLRDDFGSYFTIALGLGLFVAVDLTIAASLVFYLRKGLSGFSGTRDLVHSLMAFAVNTGVITTVCSVVIFFTFTFLGTSMIFGGFAQILTKLYANSLLGLLSTRDQYRQKSDVRVHTSSLSGRISTKPNPGQRLEIFHETTTITAPNMEHGYPPRQLSDKSDSVSSTSKAAASLTAEV